MEEQKKAMQLMVNMFEEDDKLLERLKIDPMPVLKETVKKAEEKAKGPIYFEDILLYRIAIIVLGLLALIAAVGSLILVFDSKTTPEVLVALGSAAVGALVGLFAPSPASKK